MNNMSLVPYDRASLGRWWLRGSRVLPALLVLAALATASCADHPPSPTRTAAGQGRGAASDRTRSAEQAAASVFAALQVAAAYTAATCRFSWREPYGQRERRAAAYLTPARARVAAPSPEGRAAWDASVVRDRLTGGCRILDDQILAEAPNTTVRRYVRVVASRQISQDSRPPVGDDVEYGLVLIRLNGAWRVERSSYGG